MLLVVTITGGFVIDVGPLHFSARRPVPPFVIALAAWAAAALVGRRALAAAAASIPAFIERHATSLAVVIAAGAAGAGVAYGTYSAAGADAAGYVSQAELLASAHLIREEPLARVVAWRDATRVFSPLGYRPGPNVGEIVPTYPPGLPLAMAGGRLVLDDIGPFLVVPLLGALAVLCTYGLGARMHSRTAGLVAAALLATSPIFLFQVVQPMSDVAATAWWALATLFALSPLSGSALAAGATSGIAILTRPNLLLLTIPVGLAAAGWPRLGRAEARVRVTHAVAFAAGLVPAIGAVLLLQWRLHGSPVASGYGSFEELFALSNIVPNARGYAQRLVAGEAPALWLALASIAAVALSRSRGTQAPGARVPAVLPALVGAAVLTAYLPYGIFAEWSYLRFLLPAFPLAFVVVGALLVNATRTLPAAVRGIVLLMVLVAACSAHVNIASREQVFNLRRYESRYRTAGRYLDSALPHGAIVFAVQQSTSAGHYAHIPVVRWDLLPVSLETASATLTTLGFRPVLLVEDWEATDSAYQISGVAYRAPRLAAAGRIRQRDASPSVRS